MRRIKFLIRTCCFISCIICCSKEETTAPTAPDKSSLPALHTEGRWFVTDAGDRIILRGVNIPSMEWTASGDNMLKSVDHMIEVWGCNLLRIPLSQDRWFGYGAEQSDDGAAYQRLTEAIVQAGDENGAYIWLDLHWSNGDRWGQYIGQHIMPDEKSIIFWQDVAARYKNHPAVLFGLYNEPYGISWQLWRDGGDCTEYYNRDGEDVNLTYRAVGHQELYDAIRATGAQNIVIAG
ncbi:cellulase family glycosylhydrolase, partial [candidate division KSB1 bacterium]